MKRAVVLLALWLGCGGGNSSSQPDASPSDGSMGGDGAVDPPAGQQVFAHDRLHHISIEVDAQYLEQLDTDLETRVPCTFTFDGTRLDMVGIRKKGGYGSSSGIDGKTGFSIKFNELVMGQKLDGLKRFLLNNAQEDPTFLSETVGYATYRELGQIAPLTSHAQISFNGTDKGIFIIKEAIAGDFLERAFGKANTDGNVYEGFYHPEDLELGDFVRHPEELDLKDEVEDGRSRADVTALAQLIRDTPDQTFASVVGTKMELDNFIKGFAIDTLLGFWDSYGYFNNNYYLYHSPVDDRFVYIPHGMDQLQYTQASGPMGRLAQRVEEISALDAQLDAQIAAFRTAWPTTALLARIAEVKAILATATPGDQTDQDLDNFNSNYDHVRQSVEAIGN